MSQGTKDESKFDPYEHLNIALNPDGSLTRYVNLPTTPVSGEDIDAAASIGHTVASKEIVLDAAKKTDLRIYRPIKLPSEKDNKGNDNGNSKKLPIIFHFHPGGWISMSVQSSIVHEDCCSISNEIPAIVISVGYRLAPESRLPEQYDDAMDAIKWLQEQALDSESGDRWIRDLGDLSRCYLYGSSCGGNIAFNTALRIVDNVDLAPISFKGMILNQPLFGGKRRTKIELNLAADPFFPLPATDLLWELALPSAANRDHRYCNPLIDDPSKNKIKNLFRTLVIGFGGDPLIERQQAFVKMLVMRGVQVEARFDDVGFHGIDMVDPRRAAAILSFVKEFV